MSSHSCEKMFRPFKELDRLVKHKKMELAKAPAPRPCAAPSPPLSPRHDANLFYEAMADVTPLSFDKHWRWPEHQTDFVSAQDNEEKQTIEALDRLIESGEGFVVSDTSEYMEATGPGIAPEIARRLHLGQYSIQDYVDLHGLSVREAENVLYAFIRKAIGEGKRAVLVVHGRGLTSPRRPVLKNKVYDWLTRGPLRKYVIALTSARSSDGGSGAAYVLLRRHPLTKRLRKAASKAYPVHGD